MFLLLLMAGVLADNLALLRDPNLDGNEVWTNNCTAQTYVNLLNHSTSWNNIEPYYWAVPSFVLAREICLLEQTVTVSNFDKLENCSLTFEAASTAPGQYSGYVEWEGRKIMLAPPASIYAPSNQSIVYTTWVTNLGRFTPDDGPVTFVMEIGENVQTNWFIARYVQINCQGENVKTTSPVMIGLVVGAVVFSVITVIGIVLFVRYRLHKTKDYFNLTHQGEGRYGRIGFCC